MGKKQDRSLTIAMAATKGGCMKSSLCACLAVQAASEGAKAALLDLDPQGSLSPWWSLRGKPENPKLFIGITNLADDVIFLRSQGWQYIFIDTPPGNVEIVEDAISAADFAIIPTRATAMDVLAVDPAVDACRSLGRKFAFVLTQYDPSWKLSASAAPYLQGLGSLLEPPIRYRAAYASAPTLGRTGPESQDHKQAKACREEIAALWKAIKGIAP